MKKVLKKLSSVCSGKYNRQKNCASSSDLQDGTRVSLEMTSKLADVTLKREKWNYF